MTKIYSNDYLSISENTKTSIFTIEFNYSNRVLINSFIQPKIILGCTATPDYKIVKFKAHSVKMFKQFKEEHQISINIVAQIISSLITQLSYLIKNESTCILGFTMDNILVINDLKFVFIGCEYLTDLIDGNKMQISFPFMLHDFYVSPEILSIKEIPTHVHYKSSYFSFACLILEVILSNHLFYDEYLVHKNPEKIIDCLNNHCIKHTKIYWLLSRCLVEDPKKRSIFFI